MRKVILSLLIIGLFLVGLFQQVQAQEKTKALNLNIGVVASTSVSKSFEDAYFTLGIGFDSQVGKHIVISPELQIWSYKFRFHRFHRFLLFPGAIMNFKYKKLFVGGGVIFPFSFSVDGGIKSSQLALKINAGLRTNRIKLTFYLVTFFEDIFEDILLGANMGIVF